MSVHSSPPPAGAPSAFPTTSDTRSASAPAGASPTPPPATSPANTVTGTLRRAIGSYGERVAVRHLLGQGMILLDRNWRDANGEIDAIFRDQDDVLVFVEVKTRRDDQYGTPAEAVHPAKAARLRRLAAAWLDRAGIHPREVRFDVVSVWPRRSGAARVEHLRGAF